MKNQHSRSMKGKGRLLLVAAAAFALVLSAFALAGCSSPAQPSSSSSASASSSSASAAQVQVPDVVGLKQADAETQLKNAGLAMGSVTKENSDTVSEGLVISQKPEALAMVDNGSKIDLVVSAGKKAPEQVAVPDLKGKTQEEAEKALKDVKLNPEKGEAVETTEVEAGKVAKQSVAAGTKVDEGSKVTYQLAAESTTTSVPDVVGKAVDDAKAELEKASLKSETSDAYSDTVAKGLVISQSVPASTKVQKETVIALQVSQGPKPPEQVAVPDIAGKSLADAKAALDAAGLNYTYKGAEDGVVVSVDPAIGTKVDVGSSVSFTLEKQIVSVTVPDVAGMSGSDAAAHLQSVGLVLDYDTANPGKTLDGTNPAAGSTVDEGTTVVAVYNEPEPVTTWTSASSAADAANKAGIDFFDVPGSVSFGGSSYGVTSFAYMTNAVQATYEGGALMVIVRKANGMSFDSLTADFGSYPKNWKQNYKGLEISCSGDSKKAASIMKWKVDSTRYVAGAIGLGGESVGLDPDEVNEFIVGIQ